MNSVETIFNHLELKTYRSLSYNDGVKMLYERLKEKVKEDPTFELWVPLKLRSHRWSQQEYAKSEFIQTDFVLVSNLGGIYRKEGPHKGIQPLNHQLRGYSLRSFKIENIVVHSVLHRIVASCFVPVPDELLHVDSDDLQVNHKNGIKSQSDFLNLEWCTHSQNIKHAVDAGLRHYRRGFENKNCKPVLGTVVIEGKYKGFKFIVAGSSEMKEMLGSQDSTTHIYAVLKGTRKECKGCSWRYATLEDIQELSGVVPPSELIELIKEYNPIKKGIFVGSKEGRPDLIFKTYKEAEEQGFSPKTINKCISGKLKTYRGYVFRIRSLDDSKTLTS